jgi:hypothetical protein
MTKKKPFPIGKLYKKSVLYGFILNAVLLVICCTIFNFDRTSMLSLYAIVIPSYLLKSVLFYTPFLLFKQEKFLNSNLMRTLLVWIPFMLFFFWFSIITQFQIKGLLFDLSFGYLMYFPHFYLQLLSTFIISLFAIVKIYKATNPSS